MEYEFWRQRYRDDHTPWDLGEPAPVLTWAQAQGHLPEGLWLVPGAGTGNDSRGLQGLGKSVVSLDLVPLGLSRGVRSIPALAADFFVQPLREGSFDGIWEHTFFCAIHPDRRRDYARTCHHLLKPGGVLAGVFFNHGEPDGPPFDCPADLVREVLGPWFEEIILRGNPRSPERRQGKELFGVFRSREL